MNEHHLAREIPCEAPPRPTVTGHGNGTLLRLAGAVGGALLGGVGGCFLLTLLCDFDYGGKGLQVLLSRGIYEIGPENLALWLALTGLPGAILGAVLGMRLTARRGLPDAEGLEPEGADLDALAAAWLAEQRANRLAGGDRHRPA